MTLPNKSFPSALALCLLASAAPTHAAERMEITGSAGSRFLVDATGRTDFALPTLLYFDSDGCLAWMQFGLPDEAWKNSLNDALRNAQPTKCASPPLAFATQQLMSEGVKIAAGQLEGRHVLVWYGNDQLCAPCAQMKPAVLSYLQEMLPEDTVTILLDWK